MQPAEMFGREREWGVLEGLLDGVTEGRGITQSGVLLLRGEAGIGKSFLLGAASAEARSRGFEVLTTTGVPSETHLPFASLHQLLRPILDRVADLPGPQRTAIQAAFGMIDGATADFFFIALAALELLVDCAARSPVLLVIEDIQWLDRPTGEVLAFVARRMSTERIVILAAARESFMASFPESQFPELLVERLDDAASAALIDARAPGLVPTVRERLLTEAAGNPLALVELPTAVRSEQALPPSSVSVLPLTDRLERAFVVRTTGLPAIVRDLLLLASADGAGELPEILEAYRALAGQPEAEVTVEELEPAIAAGLLEIDGVRVSFRHPLMRSAIYRAAPGPQTRAAHAAWAKVLTYDRDRQAWHYAISVGPADDTAAAALEATATRARDRGALAMAVVAQQRAADLTADPVKRAHRLLAVAGMAFDLGRYDLVALVLAEADRLKIDDAERDGVIGLRAMWDDGALSNTDTALPSYGVPGLVALAEHTLANEEPDLALQLLLGAARRCWYGDPGQAVRTRVVEAIESIGLDEDDPKLVTVLAIAEPIHRGAYVMERIARVRASSALDKHKAHLLGGSAFVTGDFVTAMRFFEVSCIRLREQGRLGLLAQQLALRGWSAMYLGDWQDARESAEEGARMANDSCQPVWAVSALTVQAAIAGMTGDAVRAKELLGKAESEWALVTVGDTARKATVEVALGLTALAEGRHVDAYDHLYRMCDPDHPSYHYMHHNWVIDYLAEAAVHSGRRQEVKAVVARSAQDARHTPSPALHRALAYARAVLAEDGDAEELYKEALAAPEIGSWPLHEARLRLAYGSWLRRQRRIADARVQLRSARDRFDALSITVWGERARQELRATGETSQQRASGARDRLSPQEYQIARMAAEGLSNREIGQRLYLSHRTVGSHLYRIFPKLSVTSRSELRAALQLE
jgi:DNA-binding CsgD family transcriptional regulator